MFCPRALGSRHGGHCARRRGSSWGVRYPKAPSRIAREGFLTEGSPPLTRIVSLLRAHGGAPRATSPQLGWEGSAVQVGGAPTQERLRGRGQRRARVPSPARPHPSASTTRGTGTPLLPPRPPPKRAHSRDTHTHHRGGDPRRTPGLRETTPPLGLRHLSDDLERSRGTTEGPTRHARAPARGGAQRSSGTALPTAGRAARGAHAGKAKREHLLCQKTHGPHRRPPRRGTGDRRSGPEAATQPPPSSPSPTARGEKSGEGPRGQTEKSRHVPREHLSLVWHGLGPARESTTTPHRSDEPRWSGGKARRGQSPEGPALSLTGNLRPPPRLRRERPTTPGGSRTPDTWHGAHRAGVASQPSPGARSGERTG